MPLTRFQMANFRFLQFVLVGSTKNGYYKLLLLGGLTNVNIQPTLV